MTRVKSIAEAERVLRMYMPQVKELLGKDLTLKRMQPVLEVLGNPHDKLNIVHVAGTSGKTSTAYYMASLLTQTGKTVGHTVSPHVDSITERIQINMQPLSENEFCQALSEFLDLMQGVDPKPTYFELLIAFVYWYFAKSQVDYAVIETGLGGSFDATNVAQNLDKICIITDIGLDHTHVLGNTLSEIASQKAGIIHPGNHVFMHQQSLVVMDVFQARTLEQHAILNVLSNNIQEGSAGLADLPDYQQRNWRLAKYAYDYVSQRDSLPRLRDSQLTKTMHIQVPGRMDAWKLGDKTIIMDGAHNEQKMMAFTSSFAKRYPGKKVPMLLGLKQGKEYIEVLPLLKPICSQLIITSFSTSQDFPANSIEPQELADAASAIGYEPIVEPDYKLAYKKLCETTSDLAVITGSFYLLSLVRPLIMKHDD